jgi:aminoglycoside/choline kinase family phosphotransferase
MVVKDDPWFIDYQGGRKGAPQYDLASFLYDAKIPLEQNIREKYLDYYVDKFCEISGENQEDFRGYYTGFTMIRLMQALGAFSFRGLYENKPTFAETIVPAVRLFLQVINAAETNLILPELYATIRLITGTKVFTKLQDSHKK